MTEDLSSSSGRQVLRLERRFHHSVEKVWHAITDTTELRHWFPSDVEVDLRPGGQIRFLLGNGEGPPLSGRVLELDRPRLFSFLWGDSVLRFELLVDDGGCLMVFSHTFDDRVSAASYAAGWHICFQNLYLLLDAKPSDVGLDQWAALHDGFVRQFDLNEGVVDEIAGGWVVRFARQLTCPVDEVWERQVGGAQVVVGGAVPPPFARGLPESGVGTVTEVDAPRVLEFTWDGDGGGAGWRRRVRWELSPGNGGARLDLRDAIPEDHPGEPSAEHSAEHPAEHPAEHSAEPKRSLASWADAVERLADGLRE
jgi:uncharacterized protein YndB with AHSA1/START domain